MTRDDAIMQSDEACWVLRLPNGEEVEGGIWEDAHYDEQGAIDAAADDAEEQADNDPPRVLVPTQLAERCWTATAVCGHRYNGDGTFAVAHGDDRAGLLAQLLDEGWKAVEGGGMTCGDDGCQTCTTLPTVAAPVEMAGQTPLIDAKRTGA